MSFYPSMYSTGMYAGTYSSKYGGTALRQKNSLNSTQNTVVNDSKISSRKSKKLNDSNYALATLSLMAIAGVAGYNMKGGIKNLGSNIGKLVKGTFNLAKKGAGGIVNMAKSGCKSAVGWVGKLFKKP